jgi:hypothetical protein
MLARQLLKQTRFKRYPFPPRKKASSSGMRVLVQKAPKIKSEDGTDYWSSKTDHGTDQWRYKGFEGNQISVSLAVIVGNLKTE